VTTPESPCTLHATLGLTEPCPGASCRLWSAEVGACVLAQVEYEIRGRPELARYLLELRHDLEGAHARIEPPPTT